MARVAGIDLPKDKRVDIALTYIYGIGRSLALKILEAINQEHGDNGKKIDSATRVKNLTEEQVSLLNTHITKSYRVEGELRQELQSNIRRYIEVGSYRGQRHRRNLPARGQRTRTNARTRRGKRRTVGSVKPGGKTAPAAASPEKK